VATYAVCADALLQRRGRKWFFSNPRTRSHVILNDNAMAALAKLTDDYNEEQWTVALSDCSGIDATDEFFGEYGLHTDHSGLTRTLESELTSVRGPALFKLLCKRWLLVDKTSPAYEQYFGRIKSILDRDHMGTFHERVGQYMTIKKRLKAERWRWWHDQKFAADGCSVREGPYKNIQESFVNDYFSRKDIRGQKILDFACGNGFYSAKLAGFGAEVTGLDTSSELIDIAKSNHGSKATFICPSSIDEELTWLGKFNNEFDALFMQDILLLLLNPEDGKESGGISQLLKLFFQVLKPGGCIYMMEPNPIFWLAGRYGDSANPYAVVTEYRTQQFNVMPILPSVVDAMAEAGFGLTEYLHPTHAANTNGTKAAPDHDYADRFPIWDFMRFTPIKT
jgi:SAM-dependent methyltransferase